MPIERALISVYDKTGIVDFARELAGLGVEIVSTGGTARLLRESSVAVRDVAERSPAGRRCSEAASKPCIPKFMAVFCFSAQSRRIARKLRNTESCQSIWWL